MTRVWYLAYGSNLHVTRFSCYLTGGRPEGGRRIYPGCRDGTPPQETAAVSVEGSLVFAGSSRTWGGGMAFLRPGANGSVRGRAYLVTASQLGDVVAQEVRRAPGSDVANRVAEAAGSLREGEAAHVADGQYDALLRVGSRAGLPMVSITRGEVPGLTLRPPAPAYLWWIGAGLRTTFRWEDHRIARYLASAPGCAGTWSHDDVLAIVGSSSAATAAEPLTGGA